MHKKTNVSSSRKQFGGESLSDYTAVLAAIVFAINLLLIIKGFRQLNSASEWYKPEMIYANLTDRAGHTGKTIVHVAKQIWLNPLKAFWHGLMWMMGERIQDWWSICDVMTYWMVTASLALSIWRTECTVAIVVLTTFLLLLKLLGYLRGFEVSSCYSLVLLATSISVLLTLFMAGEYLCTELRLATHCALSGTVTNCDSCVHGPHYILLYSQSARSAQMFLDSKGFLVVIFTILLGFSVMFQILIGPYDEDYSTRSRSFFSIFEMGILGFVDRSQFQETQSLALTVILLGVLILVVFIIALVSRMICALV